MKPAAMLRPFLVKIGGMNTVVYFAALLLAAADPPPLGLETDVVPLLTKAGCNGASCHGAAAGRGGFKLSLFGGDPAADYDAIVHQAEGRRVNWQTPAESLLLLKPTQQLDHEGGERFSFDSEPAQRIAAWIEQGARRSPRRLVKLAATPDEITADRVPAEVSIKLTATFDDGSTRDATADAVLTPSDPAALEILDNGQVKILHRGRQQLIVRYLSAVSAVAVTVPLCDSPLDLSATPRANWIDGEILATLEQLRLPPAKSAADATLLRRLTLDLTGRLPTPADSRDFATDSRPDKIARHIDRLLASPAFTDYWTFKLATWLRVGGSHRDLPATAAFHGWLRQAIADGRPFDRLAVEMLQAGGDTRVSGPANFYRAAADARGQGEYFSEVLLGVRLRCANCHNHPLDQWTQDDYHGLAAIFARIERGPIIRPLPSGLVMHPQTGRSATPRIPGRRDLAPSEDGPAALADWLVDPANPYFSQALVNRLWKSLLGRGLIEPPDDLRATNPASHSQLLARLAADFREHDFDLRHTLRLIANSAVYQRGGTAAAGREPFFAAAIARPLEAEVLSDAIADVLGSPELFLDQPPGTRAVTLIDPQTPSLALDVLGRCSRQNSCDSTAPASSAGGLKAMLHRLNGPLLNERLSSADLLSRAGLPADAEPETTIREFYQLALSRPPTAAELVFWQTQFSAADTPAARRDLLADFLWSLLTSREFTTNH